MSIKDNSADWLKQSRENLAKRLEKGLIFIQNQTKQALSQKGPPRSSAGDFPAMDSGKLRQSITHDIDKDALIGWVGSNLVYARYLEKGTNKMEPRALFGAVLEANKGALKQILLG